MNLKEHCILRRWYSSTVFKKNWIEAEETMKKYFHIVANWLAHNWISMNVSKTVVITFGSYVDSVPKDICVIIYNQIIEKTGSVEYLGMIIDYRLDWSEHVSNTCKNLGYLIYVLHKLRNCMGPNILKILYYAFFHS